jgi:GDSL-like lipase/acylhydrolase family protein
MTWLKAAVVALVVTVAAVISVTVFHRGRWVATNSAPTTAATPGRPGVASPSANSSTTPSATPTPDWVGTWSVAMAHGTTTFDRRTVRQFVRTSIGGTAARVRLSNHYGTDPLVVRDVHLALAAGGGSGVDTDTDVPVTFDGDAEVTVAAGRSIASDPVAVKLPELADVAISFTLPGTSGAATMHTLASRNNFVGQGSPPAAAELSGANKHSSYYFLAGLDVRNAAAKGAVIAFGASITDGFGSTFGTNGRWPDLLARRLADSGRTVAVLNAGISGNKLTKDGAGERAVARFDRDVLTQPGARWVIISDDALNDLGDAAPPPADDLITALASRLSVRR